MIATKSPRETESDTPRSACTSIAPSEYVLTMRRSATTASPSSPDLGVAALATWEPNAGPKCRRHHRQGTPPPPVVELELAVIVTVGSTTTSPARSPLTTSVVEFPTRPVVTRVTVVSPFCNSWTVEIDPFVVIAAVGEYEHARSRRRHDADVGRHALLDVRPAG